MNNTCTCSGGPTLLFPCSGGSNVGQIANDASRELTTERCVRQFCLAGIGGNISGIVESAKASSKNVAIDGCSIKCALRILEAAGIKVHHHVIVTEQGIEKNSNLFPEKADIQHIKKIVQKLLE